MSPQIENIMNAALALPPDERAFLVDRLVESLGDDERSVQISDEWAAELGRRVKQLEDGTAETASEEEVFREIDESLQ